MGDTQHMTENGRPMTTSAAETPPAQPLSQAPARLTHDDVLLLLGRATAEVAFLRAQLARLEQELARLRGLLPDQGGQHQGSPLAATAA